ATSVAGNDLTSSGLVLLAVNGGSLAATENDLSAGGVLVLDLAGTTGSFADNTVTIANATAGLVLDNATNMSITGNEVTATGVPGPTSPALVINATTGPLAATVTGNTFTGFSRAIAIQDVLDAQVGIDATITDNVFDFTIDAAPKVAELSNVADVIDASNNQWGSNTVLATVQGYVTRDAETVTEGGNVTLAPIKLP
ncbi:MAG TPA: hypothetical protein VFN03_12860, partial [Trueperaceae bacterium]|nr:hypothetical protein [Trueperaceae bacterium]